MKPDRLSQKLKKAFFKENGGRTSINYSDAFAGNDQKNQGRRNNSRNDSLTESKSETTVQSPKPKNKVLSNKERRAFDAKSRQLPDAVAKNLFRFKTPNNNVDGDETPQRSDAVNKIRCNKGTRMRFRQFMQYKQGMPEAVKGMADEKNNQGSKASDNKSVDKGVRHIRELMRSDHAHPQQSINAGYNQFIVRQSRELVQNGNNSEGWFDTTDTQVDESSPNSNNSKNMTDDEKDIPAEKSEEGDRDIPVEKSEEGDRDIPVEKSEEGDKDIPAEKSEEGVSEAVSIQNHETSKKTSNNASGVVNAAKTLSETMVVNENSKGINAPKQADKELRLKRMLQFMEIADKYHQQRKAQKAKYDPIILAERKAMAQCESEKEKEKYETRIRRLERARDALSVDGVVTNEQIPFVMVKEMIEEGNISMLALWIGVAEWGVSGVPQEIKDPAGLSWKGPPASMGKRPRDHEKGGLGMAHFDSGRLKDIYRTFGEPKGVKRKVLYITEDEPTKFDTVKNNTDWAKWAEKLFESDIQSNDPYASAPI